MQQYCDCRRAVLEFYLSKTKTGGIKMDKLMKLFEGKRTYLVAIVAAGLAFCASMGIVVPDWVMQILAALGLAAVRASIK